MISKMKTLALSLHNNERGDMAQIVLAVALIVIPLMLMLLAFGRNIATWFKDQNSALDGAERVDPSL
ncbi:hypothetical protein [Neorhizobium galegae]|uniref:hypothetical protein n=1 Tax=Neorhizobium galegae TaxID=399 RepID=UPI00062131EE|nr:hypothetical protein [Neorhizobium galegae]CDZ56619.1 Hypothetical protein NGAL_HAMBI2566_11700 [Neorhizobium galegae bv. orientalis]KAB1122700.1 hypothetical protein F4V90_18490 [Neorhizobium galegae]MCQ1570294.1 hypothetical protein [Neorhizobium galegae]MCQ1807865.1 hypothetical protein [Neorhizobium galegae]UIY31846.1 hypothetical protein LZK73_33750 [Neorhizobium galegae]